MFPISFVTGASKSAAASWRWWLRFATARDRRYKSLGQFFEMRNFFSELKRRKVYRVAVAYAVVAWLVIQIATQTFPFLDIPNWAVRLVIVLTILGFPAALVLAWAFDLTPQGIKRTDDISPPAIASRAANQLTSREPHAPSPIPQKSIAVLPFENLSDDRENAYFADGVHDDILSSLARIADLKVISRTSVQQYRSSARNLREIGAALGVAHILEGTVRRSGNRVRVNAQLINAETDAHVWAETFDRELTDLFAIQSELAQQITLALRANLSPREKASLQLHPTSDLEAHELYLRARNLFHWSGMGDAQENGEKALPLLEQAVTRDPQFALAYCLESRVHAELYWFGYDKRPERLAKAKAAAEKALRLRPELGDGHLALAFYYYYAGRDFDRARHELALAHRAMPNEAEVPAGFGVVDRRQGNWAASISNFEKARQLDPRNLSALWNLLETHTYLQNYTEAERAIGDGLALSPHAHFFSLARASLALRIRGDTAPLRLALREVSRDFDPGGAVSTIALRVSLMERNHEEAARLLAATERRRFNDNGLSGLAGALDGYTIPRSWYEGLIARDQGDSAAARRAFESAREEIESDLACWKDDARTLAMLGLIHAALGRRDDAIDSGQHAVERVPISKDAVDGPILATNLAVIYAQLGERDQAIDQVTRLFNLPNGPTPGLLRIEREWDPLRSDARFEKLAGAA